MSIKVGKFLLCAVVAGLLSIAAAQEESILDSRAADSEAADIKAAQKLSMADQKFLREAVQAGMAEVELGQLAVEKGSSEEVKKFAQRMVDEHSEANERLKELAASKGIKLPRTMSVTQKATRRRLAKLSGEQFDRAYMTHVLRDHKRDIAAFQTESDSAHDVDVKNFATLTLPTLRDDLKDAQSIAPQAVQARGGATPKPPQLP